MEALKATKRTELGSRSVRKLRKTGQIPAIIYGHGKDPVPVTVSRHDMEVLVGHHARLLAVDVEGKTENTLIKDIQYDTFGQEILHVDLGRVDLDERVTVTVPIVLRGTPAGIDEGGVLHQSAATVSLECPVRSIPDEIRMSVAGMALGEARHMRDLPLSEGATLAEDEDTVVCSLAVVEEAAPVEEVAEEGAEPEVIGEKKEEDQQGDAS